MKDMYIVKNTLTTGADAQMNTVPSDAQKHDAGKRAIVAAVHHQLAATVATPHGLGSSAPASHGLGASAPQDPNDPSTWDWPWVPNADGSYSIPNFAINPGDSFQEMLLKLEQAQDYLQNNPDSANGFIAYLKDIAIVGQNYQNLTPNQQNVFNLAVIDLQNQTTGTGSFASELMKMVMYGALYNNGIAKTADTITFLGNMVTLFSGLANQDPFFSMLSSAAQADYADIVVTDPTSGAQEINPQYIGTATDAATGATYQYLRTRNSPIQTDYRIWMIGELNRIGTFFMTSNVQQSQNDLMGALSSDIVKHAANTWEAMEMLLALLLNGPDQDISRQINGAGHTMDLGTGLTNQLHQIITLMQTGDFTKPANVSKLMSLFTQIADQVASHPQLSSFMSQFQSTLDNIEGMTGTIAAGASWNVSNGTYQIPPGAKVTVTEGTKTYTYDNTNGQTPMTIYVSGSGTMTNVNAITVSLQEMAYTDTANGMPVNGLGDLADAGKVIAGMMGQAQDVATALTGLTTLVTSPNSMLQNEISTDTSTKTTLEGMVKDGLAVITNLDDTILKSLQNANN